MDDILLRFQTVANTWSAKMTSYASWLFWILVLLSMVWNFGLMALKRADPGDVLAELIRFMATTSFFYWILLNGAQIAIDSINTLRTIAASASGLGNSLSPSSIVSIGFDVVDKVIDQSSITSPIDSAAGLLIGIAILVVFALVAVNMLLLLIAGWLLAYGGVFLTGFGGASWTSDIAITYFKTVIGLGMQLYAMILVVGVGQSFIDTIYSGFASGDVTLKSLISMLVASIIMLVLTNKIPPMFASLIGGASTGSIGSYGAAAALGAAATAAGAAAAAGGAVLAGATSAAGGASALKAAFQAAQQAHANGTGAFSSTGGGENQGSADTGSTGGGDTGSASSAGGGGQSGTTSSTGSSGSGLSQAMGTAGKFAAEMGSQLAKGAKQGIQAKANAMADKAAERVAQTTGGKLASEIDGSASKSRDDASVMKQADAIRQADTVQAARDLVAERSSEQTDTGQASQDSPAFDGDSIQRGNEQASNESGDTGQTNGQNSGENNDEISKFIQGNQKGQA